MQKHPLWLFSILLMASISSISQAESIKRAKPHDIPMLLNAASGENSAFLASLIGETRGRIYIEYESAVHVGSLFSKDMKRVVYWLPQSELSPEQLTQLKAYKAKHESVE